MTLDQFATITRQVIVKEGFANFQPTACYPARREVKTLAGLPSDIDPESPVLEWAARSAAPGEEFLVAFKVTTECFRIIRREGLAVDCDDYSAQE
jgi:hypothetical protein